MLLSPLSALMLLPLLLLFSNFALELVGLLTITSSDDSSSLHAELLSSDYTRLRCLFCPDNGLSPFLFCADGFASVLQRFGNFFCRFWAYKAWPETEGGLGTDFGAYSLKIWFSIMLDVVGSGCLFGIGGPLCDDLLSIGGLFSGYFFATG